MITFRFEPLGDSVCSDPAGSEIGSLGRITVERAAIWRAILELQVPRTNYKEYTIWQRSNREIVLPLWLRRFSLGKRNLLRPTRRSWPLRFCPRTRKRASANTSISDLSFLVTAGAGMLMNPGACTQSQNRDRYVEKALMFEADAHQSVDSRSQFLH